MDLKGKLIRFGLSFCLALGALGFMASPASAEKPTKIYIDFTVSGTISDVCAFPIDITSVISGFFIDYYDNDGAWIREFVHIEEQDTFEANGKSLVGLPFTFNLEWILDSDGNVIHLYAHGIGEKIPLPDGSLFISAGWLDFTNHPGAEWVISPDRGNPGDLDAFCAALAP